MWLEFTVITGVLGAGAIFWFAMDREGTAAANALRKKQSEKRARFNRGPGTESAVAQPTPKPRSFGNR